VYPNDIRFNVSCTFNNGATTVNVLTQNNVDYDPGATTQSRTLGPVPVGSVCTVTESQSRGAQSTTRIITVGGVAGASASSSTATFTVDDSGNSVDFTNTYNVGSLTVNKSIAGAWAATHPTGNFVINVVCTRQLDSVAGNETTFTGSATMTPNSAPPVMSVTFDNIIQGSVCTVSETGAGTGGATRVTITNPNSGTPTASAPTATIGATTQVRTVTNYFDEASLSVTKQVHTDAVDTDGDVVYLDAPYTVNVSCTFQGNPVYASGFSASPMVLTFTEAELTNAKTHTETLSGLPAGALCNVEESPTPGNADSVRVDWNTAATSGSSAGTSAVVGPLSADGTAPVVTNLASVHNYYNVGHFTVVKSLRGDAATAFGIGPFTVHVECVSGSVTTYDGDIQLTPTHLSETIDNLAVGSVCSATETGYGASDPDAVVYIDAFGATDDGAGVDAMAANPLVTIENWYLTGSVSVSKTVIEEAGYTFGDGPFEVTLVCEREIRDSAQPSGFSTISTTVARTMNPATPASMTQVFNDLPNGAVCTLSETNDGNASSTTITNGTATSTVAATGISFTVSVDTTVLSVVDQAQPAISVTNSFSEGELRVLKQIDSTAVDANGDPLSYGPFPTSVSCLFNGSPVYGTGYSSTTPMSRALTPGTPWDVVGLPTGAECTITEDDVLGAVATSITTVEDGGTSSTTTVDQDPTPTIPTAVLDLGPGATNSVTFDNAYEVGSIDLSKQILGLAGTKWGTADFTVAVVCELADGSTRADDTVFDDVFDRAALLAGVTIENLPTGADCAITETNTGVATGTEIVVTVPSQAPVATVADTVTVTVTNDATAIDVVVNNTFDYTAISVQKEVDGDSTGLYSVGPFEVTLACTFDGYTLVDSDIPDGLVRELNIGNSYYATFENLPVGADCTVTESKTGGANSTDLRLGTAGAREAGTDLDLVTGTSLSDVYITNYYELGGMTVNKTVTGDSFLYGDGSPLYGPTGFEVTLSCERDVDGVMTAVPLPYADTYTFGGGNPYTHDFVDLPVGAVCAITETKKGFAATSTVSAPVTILANGASAPTISIDVVNDFQLGTLLLSKESLGLFADRHAGQTFQVAVECWQDVDGSPVKIDPITDGDIRTIAAGDTTEFVDLPVPAECTFDELDDGGADLRVYSVSAVPMLGSTAVVDPGMVNVQLDNLFLLASAGTDADVWIIGALVSLLSGVCLVIIGRRRMRAVTHSR
jgi:large repetitive protein